MSLKAIILAAGKGTRMKSKLPKVLHHVAGTPMVQHVINTVSSLSVTDVNVVYGFGGAALKKRLSNQNIKFIKQQEQLGTGHAVKSAESYINDDDDVLILYGDVPLTKKATLERLVKAKPSNGIALLTVNLTDPSGYGRIVRVNDQVVGIVEQKDANKEQLQISECNTGILIANGLDLKKWLSELSNDNAQGEYYLTDIVSACFRDGKEITVTNPDEPSEVEGANDRIQLAALDRKIQLRRAHVLMREGVSIVDPNRIDVRGSVIAGEDVLIDVNCVFEGHVELESDVSIGPNCIIKNSIIAKGAKVLANSIIEDSTIGINSSIGPFARVRPGTVVKQNAKIGNFVEIKKSIVGESSKIGHLSYIGDSDIGSNVNVGAGTITCNYDGVNKHKTKIENYAFIGSNSIIVAPVVIEANSTTAAGSTITKNIEASSLAIARSKQINKKNWKPTVK